MMILSRIWYVILAILLAAAYYIVSLAVGQYNRRNASAMDETLKADSQVVSWAMQVDARRRLDVLLLAAVDPGVVEGAQGRERQGDRPAGVEGGRRQGAPGLQRQAACRIQERRPLPRRPRGPPRRADRLRRRSPAYPEFELGGYAAVFDALHGFLRDDTWVWGGRIARVVTRPVEDEVGQPPLGAVVGASLGRQGLREGDRKAHAHEHRVLRARSERRFGGEHRRLRGAVARGARRRSEGGQRGQGLQGVGPHRRSPARHRRQGRRHLRAPPWRRLGARRGLRGRAPEGLDRRSRSASSTAPTIRTSAT